MGWSRLVVPVAWESGRLLLLMLMQLEFVRLPAIVPHWVRTLRYVAYRWLPRC